MSKKLYVGNLLYDISDEDLKELFAQAGTVLTANVIRYHDSGKSKGFAFVEMETEDGAQKAMDMLNGQDFRGRKLVVSEARPPKPREFGGGGGNNRNFRGGGGNFRRDR